MAAETDPDILLLKLLRVLHEGFVDLRELGYRRGDEELVALADTFEILPTLIGRPGEEQTATIRRILTDHHARHGGRNYLRTLDQPDEEFLEGYHPPFDPEGLAPAEVASAA